MSHDPLLDKFREVRSLLTAFKNTLNKQKRFTPETASVFGDEDRKFWALQEDHERRKHSGISPASRDAMMELLAAQAVRWARLCDLAERGEEVEGDLAGSGASRGAARPR
ncbi:MAG: hypothetical protein ACRD16_15505 [Thermoanaerobaculia bacterium]